MSLKELKKRSSGLLITAFCLAIIYCFFQLKADENSASAPEIEAHTASDSLICIESGTGGLGTCEDDDDDDDHPPHDNPWPSNTSTKNCPEQNKTLANGGERYTLGRTITYSLSSKKAAGQDELLYEKCSCGEVYSGINPELNKHDIKDATFKWVATGCGAEPATGTGTIATFKATALSSSENGSKVTFSVVSSAKCITTGKVLATIITPAYVEFTITIECPCCEKSPSECICSDIWCACADKCDYHYPLFHDCGACDECNVDCVCTECLTCVGACPDGGGCLECCTICLCTACFKQNHGVSSSLLPCEDCSVVVACSSCNACSFCVTELCSKNGDSCNHCGNFCKGCSACSNCYTTLCSTCGDKCNNCGDMCDCDNCKECLTRSRCEEHNICFYCTEFYCEKHKTLCEKCCDCPRCPACNWPIEIDDDTCPENPTYHNDESCCAHIPCFCCDDHFTSGDSCSNDCVEERCEDNPDECTECCGHIACGVCPTCDEHNRAKCKCVSTSCNDPSHDMHPGCITCCTEKHLYTCDCLSCDITLPEPGVCLDFCGSYPICNINEDNHATGSCILHCDACKEDICKHCGIADKEECFCNEDFCDIHGCGSKDCWINCGECVCCEHCGGLINDTCVCLRRCFTHGCGAQFCDLGTDCGGLCDCD